MLTGKQRSRLLQIARDSIAFAFEKRGVELADDAFDEMLRRPSGAFVTLTILGDLRGCVGSIHPVAPLFRAVSNSAVSAAFRDPRFPPLRKEEFTRIEIEISVMGPIEPVKDADEILVGRDGLIVSRGRNTGLLLPQVATEYGWNRDIFLGQTCRKAGLPSDAWRLPDCRIERFPAEVFNEETAES